MKLGLILAGLLSVPALMQANVMSFGYTNCEAIAIAAGVTFMEQDTRPVLLSSQTACSAMASAGVTGASASGVVSGGGGFIGASSAASGTFPDRATGSAGASFIDWVEVLPGTKSGPIAETKFSLDIFGAFSGDGGATAAMDVNGGDLHLLALANSVLTLEHVSGFFGMVVGQFYPVTESLGTGAHNGNASFSNTALFHIDAPDGYTLVSLSGIDYSSSVPNPDQPGVPEPRAVSLGMLAVIGAILAIRKQRGSPVGRS
jgi:hypothetical protein